MYDYLIAYNKHGELEGFFDGSTRPLDEVIPKLRLRARINGQREIKAYLVHADIAISRHIAHRSPEFRRMIEKKGERVI